MARRSGGIGFGPIIGLSFLILFLVITVVFANVIFGSTEYEMNTSSMDNETLANYNNTTTVIQGGLIGISVAGWILILAVILVGIFVLYRAVA